jgi:hypothetical protein
MKVLLQSLETKTYFCGEQKWTENADEAVDFQEVVLAVDYVLERGLENVRAVVKFGNSYPDVVLPAVGRIAYQRQ